MIHRNVLKTATALVAAFGVTLGSGCGSSATDFPQPTILSVNAGVEGQTGVAGQPLAMPISVHVVDQNGSPMQGETISWTIRAGGGSVNRISSVTDIDGNATTIWTLGPTPGPNRLQATTLNALIRFIDATGVAAPAP